MLLALIEWALTLADLLLRITDAQLCTSNTTMNNEIRGWEEVVSQRGHTADGMEYISINMLKTQKHTSIDTFKERPNRKWNDQKREIVAESSRSHHLLQAHARFTHTQPHTANHIYATYYVIHNTNRKRNSVKRISCDQIYKTLRIGRITTGGWKRGGLL